jgi:hypothetical protein
MRGLREAVVIGKTVVFGGLAVFITEQFDFATCCLEAETERTV